MSRGRPAILIALAGLAIAGCNPASPQPSDTPRAEPVRLPKPATALALVDQFIANPPRDRADVERIVGVRLDEKPGRYWTYYASRAPTPVGEGAVSVDLRIAGEGATAEESLFMVLDFTGPCTPKAEVFTRYPGLELNNVAAPHPMATNNYGRAEPWGEIGFGFTRQTPDCLADVVFQVR